MFDLLLLFQCSLEVGRGPFWPFSLSFFFIVGLAFPPSRWGLASDSGTNATPQGSTLQPIEFTE